MGKTNKRQGIKDKNILDRLKYAIKNKELSQKILSILLKKLLLLLESVFQKHFLTFHIRPATISTFSIQPSKEKRLETAIIIQGPIDQIKNFTLESAKIYKQLFPSSMIILSTWDDEKETILSQFYDLGAKIVTSAIPNDNPLNNTGWGTIDLQSISAQAGIRYALNHDIKYCMKTRTDQRFYKPELIEYFLKLQTLFPLQRDTNQSKRLISSSFVTPKFRVYGLTDMMMFGETNDLFNYWNVENYSKGIYKYLNDQCKDIPPIVSGTLIGAEVYFMSSYLKKLGENLNWTLKHYWKMLGEYFLIVDGTSIDTYWNKYNKGSEYQFGRDYNSKAHRLLDFMDWVQLYGGKNIKWETLRDQEKWERSNGKLIRLVN